MMVALACLLVVAVLFYILFVRPQDVPEPLPASPIQHLEDRKHAIYENLRDLQFEYRLGKLSDADYQTTKQALQKELAVVLAETESVVQRLGLKTAKAKAASAPQHVCPHCGAKFKQALKFCGECGKAMT